MKKSFLFLSILLFFLTAYSQHSKTTIWSENFDSEDLSAWTLLDGDNDGFLFRTIQMLGPDFEPIGTPFLVSCSYTQFDNIGHVFPFNWAITPAIDLSSVSPGELIQLNWALVDSAYSWNPSPNNENYSVYIAEENDTLAFIEAGIKFTEHNLPLPYTLRSLDISEFAGKSIYIAFRHYNVSDSIDIPFSSSLQIDDISVTVGATSFTVLPTSLSQTLDSGEQASQQFTITNTGTGDLTYQATIDYSVDKTKNNTTTISGSQSIIPCIQISQENIFANPVDPKANKDGIVIHYDGPNQGNKMGLSGGGSIFSAVCFTSDILNPYNGFSFESLDVFVADMPSSFKLMIWDEGTTTAPGQLLFEQTVEPVPNSWNSINLNQAIEISGNDLWVGFECTHEESVFPLGIDNGPAINNAGWLSLDGLEWIKLPDAGLNANLNTRINLQYTGIQWLVIDPATQTIGQNQSQTINVLFNASGLSSGTYTANIVIIPNEEDDLQVTIPVSLEVNAVYYSLVFNIKNDQGISIDDAIVTIDGVSFTAGDYQSDLEPGTYAYTIARENYFPVTGELTMANENQTIDITMEIDDTATPTMVDNTNFNVYPNPASDYLTINAPEGTYDLRIIDAKGAIVFQQKSFNPNDQIDIKSLSNGEYLLQLISPKGSITKQIQIIK